MVKRLAVALWLGAALSAPAAAFGTIDGLGQHTEHEEITRAALVRAGLDRETLDSLAGRKGTFGAVGAPDRPDRGLLGEAAALIGRTLPARIPVPFTLRCWRSRSCDHRPSRAFTAPP